VVAPDEMEGRGEDESVPPASARSDVDELKNMLAVLMQSMSVQTQKMDAQAQKIDEQGQRTSAQVQGLSEMLRTGLLAVTKEARQLVSEQCESLRDELAQQLAVIKAEAEGRVEGAVERVEGLREEVAELRVTVERQAARQQGTERAAGAEGLPAYLLGERHGHRGALSEPGDVRPWGGANSGQQSGVAALPPFPAQTWQALASPVTPPRSPSPPSSVVGVQSVCSPQAASGARSRRKPAEFDGRVAWEAYQAQFELLARGQGWSAEDMALQLVASLRGPALEVLTYLTPGQRTSYVRVAEALQRRFGSSLQAEVYRARLKGRARQQGEPLPQLAQDLESLVRRAYPAASEEMVAVLARDHFVDALGSQQVQIYVKQAHPVDVQAALARAMEFEAFLRTTGGPVAPAAPYRHLRARRTQTQRALPQKRRSGSPGEFRGACWKCGQRGHRRSECKGERRTRSLEELPTYSSPPPCCWNCGQQGHTRASCRQLKDVMMVGGNMNGLGARPVAQPASPGAPTV